MTTPPALATVERKADGEGRAACRTQGAMMMLIAAPLIAAQPNDHHGECRIDVPRARDQCEQYSAAGHCGGAGRDNAPCAKALEYASGKKDQRCAQEIVRGDGGCDCRAVGHPWRC